jgi:hypothetical protein
MATLVNNTPTDGIATFMTGLLSSFYDEDVPLIESQRLLGACVQTLQNLCLSQPLVISSSPPFQRIAERMVLLEMLMDVAYQVINIEEITPVNAQLSLPL